MININNVTGIIRATIYRALIMAQAHQMRQTLNKYVIRSITQGEYYSLPGPRAHGFLVKRNLLIILTEPLSYSIC